MTGHIVYTCRVTFVEQPQNELVSVITYVVAVLLTFTSEKKERLVRLLHNKYIRYNV